MHPHPQETNPDLDPLNDINAAMKARGVKNRVTIHRQIKAGKFPKPDAVIAGRNYWLTSTLRRYIAEQVEAVG
jgi:predicted DNA-binding transcriptional regulator AlpA